MDFDAVILAGGRASRLGGVPKGGLLIGGLSLLDIALDAASGASSVVVVGDAVPGARADVRFTREIPAFGGPVAALAAGLRELELSEGSTGWLLVLACDMPDVAAAVELLRDAADSVADDVDGLIAVDETARRQFLAAIYRVSSLSRALAALPSPIGASMRELVTGLTLLEIPVPSGSTSDIDTWADAEHHGVASSMRTASAGIGAGRANR